MNRIETKFFLQEQFFNNSRKTVGVMEEKFLAYTKIKLKLDSKWSVKKSELIRGILFHVEA